MNYIETREELLEFLPKNSIGVEVGVWKGQFSKIILKTLTPKMLYLVDPWEGTIMSGDKNGENISYINGPEYFSNYILPEFLFLDNVKILNTYSSILQMFPDEYMDWIYIDGDHNYESVKHDLEISYSKIKKDGFIMGHDYTTDIFPGLVKAVDEFCLKNKLNIKYLTKDGCPSYLIIK
jgi:hypothetical protein